jgi:hypothetical protein
LFLRILFLFFISYISATINVGAGLNDFNLGFNHRDGLTSVSSDFYREKEAYKFKLLQLKERIIEAYKKLPSPLNTKLSYDIDLSRRKPPFKSISLDAAMDTFENSYKEEDLKFLKLCCDYLDTLVLYNFFIAIESEEVREACFPYKSKDSVFEDALKIVVGLDYVFGNDIKDKRISRLERAKMTRDLLSLNKSHCSDSHKKKKLVEQLAIHSRCMPNVTLNGEVLGMVRYIKKGFAVLKTYTELEGEWSNPAFVKDRMVTGRENASSGEDAKPIVSGKEPTVLEALLVTALAVGGIGGFFYLIAKLTPSSGHSPKPANHNYETRDSRDDFF